MYLVLRDSLLVTLELHITPYPKQAHSHLTGCMHAQLMLAAYHGHAELVKFLIEHGADPNRLNDRLQSPLAGAVFKKEDDVIEVSRYRSG